MWKKKKVKAGVLLYALVMVGIFSLLFQFYLNRQVAHHRDYVLNKEKLVAYAMAKRTRDKFLDENGGKSYHLGSVTYQSKETGFTTVVQVNKNQFEFHFPPLKKAEKTVDKKESEQKEQKEKTEKIDQGSKESKINPKLKQTVKFEEAP